MRPRTAARDEERARQHCEGGESYEADAVDRTSFPIPVRSNRHSARRVRVANGRERRPGRPRLWTIATLACAVVAAAAHPGPAAASRYRPVFSAVFNHTTYVPGQRALLELRGSARTVDLQLLRAGAERAWSSVGKRFGPPRHLLLGAGRIHTISVRMGGWPSGLYYARVTGRNGRLVAFAPFVLHPARLGGSRVAIVIPTYSWQAYNFYDANGDGRPDSWYRDAHRHSVLLGRPFVGDGKPPHYRTQERGFLRFLVHSGKHVDYLTDEDLERVVSGEQLAGMYDLIVFSGHEEYVTGHIYDLIQRYRDLGGNLAVLSADNFFLRVDRINGRLWRIQLWRNLGRPEASLIGVQYRGNDRGGHAAPYIVTSLEAAPWLFAGLAVGDGSPLGTGRYGIEFDMVTQASPPGTTVLATVSPNLLGDSILGQMTYYTTPEGAKVFAAGTLSFGGSDNPTATVLFQNIWQQLTQP
jgi:hypothetical protein